MNDKRLKALQEMHESICAKMNAMVTAAVDENGEARALDEAEAAEFAKLEAQAKQIKESIEMEKRAMEASYVAPKAPEAPAQGTPAIVIPKTDEERAKDDTELFDGFLRGTLEEQRAGEMLKGENGVVIPTTIANKIIDEVKDIFPIWDRATRYNVPGTLTIPYYDITTNTPGQTRDITMAYADEFTELESTSGKFANITLSSYLAGVLTKISKSLLTHSQFDLTSFVIRKMAFNIAKWLENEIFHGTPNKIEGLTGIKQKIYTASSSVLTSDELIDLQETIMDSFQDQCVWVMNRQTRTYVRKLKDGQGNYLLNRDYTGTWDYTLLGKPVYVTDAVASIGAGIPFIYYGDYSGLALKVNENYEINVLREKFALEHAIGVYAYLECDSKIENQQKLAVLCGHA